jgi:hypothetical protein
MGYGDAMESGNRIESIIEHFRRVDNQDPSMIDLFTEGPRCGSRSME